MARNADSMNCEPPTSVTPAALKTEEAAAYLGCSRSTLWKYHSTGKIARLPHGAFARVELDRFLAEASGLQLAVCPHCYRPMPKSAS